MQTLINEYNDLVSNNCKVNDNHYWLILIIKTISFPGTHTPASLFLLFHHKL